MCFRSAFFQVQKEMHARDTAHVLEVKCSDELPQMDLGYLMCVCVCIEYVVDFFSHYEGTQRVSRKCLFFFLTSVTSRYTYYIRYFSSDHFLFSFCSRIIFCCFSQVCKWRLFLSSFSWTKIVWHVRLPPYYILSPCLSIYCNFCISGTCFRQHKHLLILVSVFFERAKVISWRALYFVVRNVWMRKNTTHNPRVE